MIDFNVKNNKPFYGILLNKSINLMEEMEDFVLIKFFLSENNAIDYQEDIIEKNSYMPSAVSIEKINFNEINRQFPEFEVWTKYEYNKPVRVMISYWTPDMVIEDTIFESEMMYN